MLKGAIDVGKQILSVTRDVQQSKTDIVKLTDELKDIRKDVALLRLELTALERVVERMSIEFAHRVEATERERRIQQLEIENRFLRYERRIPPPDNDSEA